MRRADYEMTEEQEIERLLETVGHGFMRVNRPDGWPGVVPLNFVYADGRIYFHGALEGEKMEGLRKDDRVTFTVVEEFSVVPSYFRDPRFACVSAPETRSVAAVLMPSPG